MERDFLGLSSREASGVVKTDEISSEPCRDSDNMAFMQSAGLNDVFGTRWSLSDKFCAVPDLKQELPGGGVVATPFSGLLGAASTVGTTELRKAVKSYCPSQLTIFYAGTVIVYDDIPPEKVHAIMFLVGNGTSKSPKTSHSGCHIQAPTPGNVIGNRVVLKQPTTWPCSDLLSPFSVVSHPAPKLGSGPANMEKGDSEGVAAPSKVDSPKMDEAVKSYCPSQLTIFYAGTVIVYDDIPPEKVQAIMVLVGNGTSKSPKTSHSGCHIQAPTPGNVIGNRVVLKQPATWPCSGLLSPFSVVSHPAPKLGSGPANMEKGDGEGVAAPSKVDSPKMDEAKRSISVTTMLSAGIPQVPMASLGRFLEKRKERVRNAAPYILSKNSSLECATPTSGPVKLSSGPAMDKDCTQ